MKCEEIDYFGEIDVKPIMDQALIDFPIDRNLDEYQSVFYKENPLVSVLITTFNKADLLVNYSLKSVMEQTYKNLDIFVMGDNCTDRTKELLSEIDDDRVTFINLLNRPPYPEGKARWQVAGCYNYNLGISLLKGDFSTYLDDDDMFVEDRIEKLIKFAQENKYDAIHHPFATEGHHEANLSLKWGHGSVTTSALFNHKWFNRFPADTDTWRIDEPGDWNRCKKFQILGANIGRHPDILTIKKPSTTLGLWYQS